MRLRILSLLAALAVTIGFATGTGCGSGGTGFQFIGSPFTLVSNSSSSGGPSSTGQSSSGGLGQSDRTPVDPCTEPQARKFVTISMRNVTTDYIHYFFIAIAFVDVDETDPNVLVPSFDTTSFPDGAACATDIPLYTQFGYLDIPANVMITLGDYCIGGPALIYFHRGGQFRLSTGVGSTGLGSAIAPAQGSSPTFDNFFTSAGAQIPVPDLILFHNPGTGEGAALKVSPQVSAPCDLLSVSNSPTCLRDAFYYVDETDLMAGSTALGPGAGRRVPAEIQGTGCECTGLSRAYQILAPSRVRANDVLCNEFLRAGRIEYTFLRDDENPPFPQLLWRVTDSSGALAQEPDSRAGVP
jgi:hypothetical protein